MMANTSMDQDDYTETSNQTVIEEPLENGRITGRWCSVNSFMVHAKRWSTSDYQSGADYTGHVTLKEIRWHADTQHYIYRKLINETHAIFMQLQDLSKDNGNFSKSMRLQISHQYRSVMQSCIVELQHEIKKKDDERMRDQLELLTIMEMIWHLCEIILIDTKPGGYCISQLLEWIKWHFTQTDRLAETVLLYDEPHTHDQYWPTIIGYVLQGRLEDSLKLLSFHPEANEGKYNAFRSMEDIMRQMPFFKGYMGQSAQDFNMKWKKWQQECRLRLESGDFSTHPSLEAICEIFCGQEETLERNRELCQSWYEFLVAKLLYTEPTIKIFDLHSHSMAAVQASEDSTEQAPLDEIVLAVMDFDVHKMIRKCSECLPNWWFVAHLTDLLYHCELLKEHELGYSFYLREFLLLDYSQSLMSNRSLWQIAIDYLISCPKHGRSYLEIYIEHIPLDTDKKASKIFRVCQKHSLINQANSICKVMAMRCLKTGRLGSALSWCIKSKDAVFANLLAERIFNHYLETGMLSQLDIMSNLGSAMLLSDKLTFLGKYREFHALYNEEKFEEAGTLLLQLLSSSLAPKRFWLTLMIDALPLLEHDKIIFNSSQTYEIINCLQELQLSLNSKKYLDWPVVRTKTLAQDEEDRDKLAFLRLGLSRNLARTILQGKSN